MANGFFKGTIQTLSNLVQQEQQRNALKETPQFQAALLNLVNERERLLRLETFREALPNIPTDQVPEFISRFFAGEGQASPFVVGQQKEMQAARITAEEEAARVAQQDKIKLEERKHELALERIKVRDNGDTGNDKAIKSLDDKIKFINDQLKQTQTIRQGIINIIPGKELENKRLRDQLEKLMLKKSKLLGIPVKPDPSKKEEVRQKVIDSVGVDPGAPSQDPSGVTDEQIRNFLKKNNMPETPANIESIRKQLGG